MTFEIVDNTIRGSVDDLAELVGVSKRRVQQLEKSRVMLRIAHGVYDVPRSVLSYCNYLRTLDSNPEDKRSEASERVRLTSAKADIAEIEALEKSAAVVDANAIRKQDFTLARILRNNLQTMPDRIAALIAAESDAHTVHKIISDEVRQTLEQIIASMEATEIDEAELDVNRRSSLEQLETSEGEVSQETPDGAGDL